MPRIRPAKSSPSPSRKKDAERPSCGSHSISAVMTSPRMTEGARTRSIASASAVGTAVKLAQAVRPARIIMPGISAPRKGAKAIAIRRLPPSIPCMSMSFAVYRVLDHALDRT